MTHSLLELTLIWEDEHVVTILNTYDKYFLRQVKYRVPWEHTARNSKYKYIKHYHGNMMVTIYLASDLCHAKCYMKDLIWIYMTAWSGEY